MKALKRRVFYFLRAVTRLSLKFGYSLTFNGIKTSDGDLKKFIQKLRPVSMSEELIRIGGSGDGGYLLPDNLQGILACFSPGVSGSATFEKMLADEFGIKSYMADFSVERPPIESESFHFEKKFLGRTNDEIYIRLQDWVNNNVGEDSEEDLLLQMDIEGDEYRIILDTPLETFKRFRIMAIEFHAFDMVFNKKVFALIEAVFDKLRAHFSIVHIHPNNYCEVMSSGGADVPPVLEFTFYRNDFVKKSDKKLSFPHMLDKDNIPQNPEVILPESWWKF